MQKTGDRSFCKVCRFSCRLETLQGLFSNQESMSASQLLLVAKALELVSHTSHDIAPTCVCLPVADAKRAFIRISTAPTSREATKSPNLSCSSLRHRISLRANQLGSVLLYSQDCSPGASTSHEIVHSRGVSYSSE
jgi:hypothetical protein